MARTGGRQKGSLNKLTSAFRDAVHIVYEDIGGHAAFADWTRENPTEFYKIAARLIPAEVKVSAENKVITVIVDRWGAMKTLGEPNRPMLPVPAVEY